MRDGETDFGVRHHHPFVSIWNDYFWPLVAINHVDNQVIATGVTLLLLKQFQITQPPDYPSIFVLATITIIPPVLVYLWQ